jgi:hypothetical protein
MPARANETPTRIGGWHTHARGEPHLDGVIVVLAIAMLAILQHNRDEDRDARQATAKRLLVEVDRHELCYRERFGRYRRRRRRARRAARA